MEYLSNLELVQSLARQIVQDRRCNYSQQSLHNFLNSHTNVQHKTLAIPNQRKQVLLGSLFRSANPRSTPKPCIVYLHALGSNRLQALHILDTVSAHHDVMSFDFSGSGKSQGEFTTFGLWEKEDIHSVIQHLSENQQYQNYILWGRSMGAVSAALYVHKYPASNLKCLILDSAFSSFEKTALELACGKSSLPQFMLNACMIPLKKCFKENYPFDPFEIDLRPKMKEIACKVVLIYSERDTVVSWTNSKIISESCLRFPDTIKIDEDHNTYRKVQTYSQVLKIIQDTLVSVERRSRSRGIRLYSKDKDKKENKKGVELSRCASRLRTQQNTQRRTSLNGRRNSIFSAIQTQADFADLPKRNRKIYVLPTFYESELLMLNSHKQKHREKQKDEGKQHQDRQNKQNSRLGDNLVAKLHITAIRRNRFGLK